jgi:hypothetical protein
VPRPQRNAETEDADTGTKSLGNANSRNNCRPDAATRSRDPQYEPGTGDR